LKKAKHWDNPVPFAPGQSGNPNDRPVGALNHITRSSRAAALEHAPAVMKELARIALNDENIALRIAVGKEILDRALWQGPLQRSMAMGRAGR
jgi:hypothetical protein